MKNTLITIILLVLIGAVYCVYRYYPEPITRILNNSTATSTTQTKDQKVIAAGKEVLKALADKNYVKLQSLASVNGLSLKETPNLDFSKSDVSKADIINIPTDTKTKLWGYTDGKGDEIILSTKDFL